MMQQGDLFDETLTRKIYRMEKWVVRLQKELWFLKEVHTLKSRGKGEVQDPENDQMDLWA